MPNTDYSIISGSDLDLYQIPAIAVTSNGHIHAFFRKSNQPSGWGVYKCKSTNDGQTWSTPVQIFVSGDTYGTAYNLVACTSGNGVNIYVGGQGQSGGGVVYISDTNDDTMFTLVSSYNFQSYYSNNFQALAGTNKLYGVSGAYPMNPQFYLWYVDGNTVMSSYIHNISNNFELTNIDVAATNTTIFVVFSHNQGGMLIATKSTDNGATFSPTPYNYFGTQDSSFYDGVSSSKTKRNISLFCDGTTVFLVYVYFSGGYGLKLGKSPVADGTNYYPTVISGIPAPNPTQDRMKVKKSGTNLYIVYTDNSLNIQMLTSTNDGTSFTVDQIKAAPTNPYILTLCDFTTGSTDVLYYTNSSGTPSLFGNIGGGSPICFHPDSMITLKNGEYVKVSELKIGDQLVDFQNKVLTITDLLIQIPATEYYQIDDDVFVTGHHLVKNKSKNTRLAKQTTFPKVEKPPHQCDYHIRTDGHKPSHFIPMKNGCCVEVLGKYRQPVEKKLRRSLQIA